MVKELDLKKLVAFFDDNADILHVSRYHKENFKIHCLLVISGMMDAFEDEKVSEAALVAACLHDIAKPRTAKLNKRNEACFYGHENVSDDELCEFLDRSYPEFDKVVALVRLHMLPFGVGENTPEPYRSQNQARLDEALSQHDEQFKDDLMTLSECDRKACVKAEEDLPEAESNADEIRELLLTL